MMFINKYTLSSNNITYPHTSAWLWSRPELSSDARPLHSVRRREQETRKHGAGAGDHPGIVSPWSQIFSLNMECIVNFARYNEYSRRGSPCHKGRVTKPRGLPPSLPCPFRVINIIFRFVILAEFNKTLLYTFLSNLKPKPISLPQNIFLH